MDILKRREYYKKWYYSRRIGQNQEINNLPYEEWKDVVFDRFGKHYDFTGQYQLSNYGRLKSMERDIPMKDGRTKHCYTRIIKPSMGRGYYQYQFDRGNIIGMHTIICAHRLVGLLFIPIPERLKDYNIDSLEVNHIDENKLNNIYIEGHPELSNLEWVTKKENANHGTCQTRKVESYKNNNDLKVVYQKILDAKIAKGYIRKIRAISIKDGSVLYFDSIGSATRFLKKKAHGNIWKCLNGRIDHVYGYKWEYI